METLSSILAWKIPGMKEPGGLQSIGSQRITYDEAHTHTTKLSCFLNSPICVNVSNTGAFLDISILFGQNLT